LTRQLSQGFPDAIITGTDISADLIDVARSRHHDVLNCSFLVAAGEVLPLARLAFDAVVIERVLQHCSDPAAILREWARVLKPGGRLFLCEPDWHGLDIQPMPAELFPEILSGYLSAFMRPKIGSELEHLLNEVGFQDVSILRDDWLDDYPASGRILGLNRIVEIAVGAGISIDRAAAFEALFHDTRAALRLPMYHAVARTAG
jgi:SAM-dependent methyltransferase